jgi:hypothetical protein
LGGGARLISYYLAGNKKSQNKNFDDHNITTIYLALMPKLTVAMMEMFSSLKNSWTLC